MTAKGHTALAVPITVGGYYLINEHIIQMDYVMFSWFFAFSIFGSVLPDIDEPNSYVGRKFPIFSHILAKFIKHRGVTHLLIIPIGVFLIGIFVTDELIKISLFGLSVGILAHDIGDMLTKGGIRGFFFPFFPSTTIGLMPKILRFRTGSAVEYIFVGVVMLVFSYYYGDAFLQNF